MTVSTFRHTPRPLAALVAALLLSGCGAGEDPRVTNLAQGISKDSAMAVMGGPPGDLPEVYLKSGRLIETYMFRRETAPMGSLASLTRENLTPVVLLDGTLSGWGWDHWDSVAAANQITVSHAR